MWRHWIIGLTYVVLSLWYYMGHRKYGKDAVYLPLLALLMLVGGLAATLFSFFIFPNLRWATFGVSFAIGTSVGLTRGWLFSRRCREEIRLEGHLAPKNRLERWSVSWWVLISLCLIVFVLHLLEVGQVPDILWRIGSIICTTYVGSWGAYIWVWTRQMEREGYRSLVIPTRERR